MINFLYMPLHEMAIVEDPEARWYDGNMLLVRQSFLRRLV
jgi:hypothetical protein